jgi:hypothetical protein
MIKPDRNGEHAFARFLSAGTVYRDMSQLPAYLRQPGTVAHFMNAPHDAACVGRFLDDLVVAMIGGAMAQSAPQ